MTDTASKVAHQYLYQQGTPLRVAARFYQKVAQDGYKHKVVGKDARLWWGSSAGWTQPSFLIEELPQKGKKKLGRFELRLEISRFQNWLGISAIYFGADTLIKKAGISSSDNYDSMVKKLKKAIEEEADDLLKNVKDGRTKTLVDPKEVEKSWASWISYYPREEQVFYLNVMPEGIEPFTAIGKDFQIDVSWTKFKAMDPNSDLQQADPHYTIYEAKSASAARKLYQILNADREALKSVAWSGLGKWLTQNKIPYDIKFSSW